MEKVVKDELGFNIKFENKPIEEWIDIEYKKSITLEIEKVEQTETQEEDITNGIGPTPTQVKKCIGVIHSGSIV